MTKDFELLKQGPQTGVGRTGLSYEERIHHRQMRVVASRSANSDHRVGRFVSVSYLEGDEEEAAALFVEENRQLLETIGFSRSNSVQRSLSREMYDLVLHHLGVRRLEKLSRAVTERRPEDEEAYIISRDKFESAPNRRYATGETGTAKVVDVSLEQLYADLPSACTLADLPNEAEGDVAWIFAYFDESSEFECVVTPGDSSVELVKKRSP